MSFYSQLKQLIKNEIDNSLTNTYTPRATHPDYPKRLDYTKYINRSTLLTKAINKKLVELYHTECPHFESKIVQSNAGKWADHNDVSEDILKNREIWEYGILTPLCKTDIIFRNGRPVTPVFTGINGRGLLGRFGPNHAADPIVTRYNPETNDLEFVAALRSDTDPKQWCIPGGMVDPGESVSLTLKREFTEEVACQADPKILDKVFAKGDILYAGPTYGDPRTTDSAWIETYVVHYHISDKLARKIKFTPQPGENVAVQWVSCNALNLYGDHQQFIALAKQNMKYKTIKKYLTLSLIPVVIGLGYMFSKSSHSGTVPSPIVRWN